MASSNQLEKFLGHWHSAKRETVAYSMILQENARKPGVHPRSCVPLAIESANSLRFLWTALSIEGAVLSIEIAPFYRMVYLFIYLNSLWNVIAHFTPPTFRIYKYCKSSLKASLPDESFFSEAGMSD